MTSSLDPDLRPDIISHPTRGMGQDGVPLVRHLQQVATRVLEVVPHGAFTLSGLDLADATQAIAWVHDLGKATRSFQAHVRDQPGPDDIPSHHSPLGALAAYEVLKARGAGDCLRLAGLLAVARHHGRLPDAMGFLTSNLETPDQRAGPDRYGADVKRQVADIEDHASEVGDAVLREASEGELTWSAFREAVASGELKDEALDDIGGEFDLILSGSGHTLPDELYETTLQLWSGLLLADKSTAAQLPETSLEIQPTRAKRLQRHVDELEAREPDDEGEQRINRLRRKARQEALASIEEGVISDHETFSLTLPTGVGKTLTGLQVAHQVRDASGDGPPGPGPIIYALPYTSIIDQVGDEVRSIFDAAPRDPRITLHHHLSDTAVRIGDATTEPTDEEARLERMLGTSWRSGLVVTTFVQLFESLAGPRNRGAMKLPSLHGSVIVLDEPQAVPHEWWQLVPRLVELAQDRYGAKVLAMTATPPKILEEAGIEARELIPEPATYFEALDRVRFEVHPSVSAFIQGDEKPLAHAEAADALAAALEPGGPSVMAVCNTIPSARSLSRRLRDRFPEAVSVEPVHADLIESASGEAGDITAEELVDRLRQRLEGAGDAPILMHLTSRVRPRDRLRRIEVAKALAQEEIPFLVVSTQLIEAGVDISFDHVFRDLAPLSSLVQAAGRCNRAIEQDQGEVTIWWLDATGKGGTPAELVYARTGENLLSPTAAALGSVLDDHGSPLPEPSLTRTAVARYFARLHDRGPGSRELVDHLENAEAQKLGEASMIASRESIEVLVVRSDSEHEQLERLRQAWEEDEYEQGRDHLRTLQDTQVSIPIYDPRSRRAQRFADLPLVHADAEIRLLDVRDPGASGFFDRQTGEIVEPGDTVEARFL